MTTDLLVHVTDEQMLERLRRAGKFTGGWLACVEPESLGLPRSASTAIVVLGS